MNNTKDHWKVGTANIFHVTAVVNMVSHTLWLTEICDPSYMSERNHQSKH